MFGRARIYEVADDVGDPVRLLEVGGIVQSGTYTDERYADLVFAYLKAYDVLFDRRDVVRRVCVLGCGGYDYPEHLIAHRAPVVVDAVEIDPVITALARRYFFLDRIIEEYDAERSGRLNLVCADALAHLESTDARYDAIVNDAFDGGEPPAHLLTERFARAVRSRLNPGGLYLTNIVSAVEGPGSALLRDQVALLESLFETVEVLPCDREHLTDEDNVIVVAHAAACCRPECG